MDIKLIAPRTLFHGDYYDEQLFEEARLTITQMNVSATPHWRMCHDSQTSSSRENGDLSMGEKKKEKESTDLSTYSAGQALDCGKDVGIRLEQRETGY
ncbi:hypothetical protein BaRGS_00015870 [Batillaria attramentaria]|uniref:Uncharacterized protein n=1 Tax=Batillaria attramentaria TaxID=370345 RepID=A0ABD0L092_9CAEN